MIESYELVSIQYDVSQYITFRKTKIGNKWAVSCYPSMNEKKLHTPQVKCFLFLTWLGYFDASIDIRPKCISRPPVRFLSVVELNYREPE